MTGTISFPDYGKPLVLFSFVASVVVWVTRCRIVSRRVESSRSLGRSRILSPSLNLNLSPVLCLSFSLSRGLRS